MRLNLYLGTIISVGIAALYVNFNITEINHVAYLLLLLLFGLLFAFYEVELPYGRYYSGTSNIFIISFILFGLTNALIVLIFVSLTEMIYYKYGWKKGLYNLTQDSLCLIVSAYIYQLLGGTIGPPASLFDFLLIAAMVVIYLILNLIFLSVVFYLIKSDSYVEILSGLLKDGLAPTGGTVFLSLFFVSTYNETQPFLFIQSLIFLFLVFMLLRYVFQHYVKVRKSHISMIESLTQMTDQKTNQNQHAARVGWIAKQIGEAIKLPPDQLDQLYYAAMFHDIGKTSINEKVFQKKGPLTLDEQKDYRTHVTLGYEWLTKIDGFQPIAEIVLRHHEKWDGGGFPDGLSGNDIPYLSRIIAIANQLDHLLSEEKSGAFTKLEKMAGTCLDPELVRVTVQISAILERYEDSKEITEWIKMSDYVNDVREKIYNSELLNHFGVNIITNYEAGGFYNHSNQAVTVPCAAEVMQLAERSIREGQPVRHNLEDRETGTIYDVYSLPVGKAANIMLFDVTRVISYEKEQEMKMKKIYKDVIYAVTQSKMLLVEADELNGYFQGSLEATHEIHVPTDITECRHLIDGVISSSITNSKKKYQVLLCVNECLTNVLKHAQQGQMKIYADEGVFRILIQDNGSGIDLADLPKSTLMQGYSTKLSLGQGYKLMLNYSDKLILCTNSSGTSIILEFKTDHSMITSARDLFLPKEEGMKLA
jgi:putative nucleotidyltransferase with HDIG domain